MAAVVTAAVAMVAMAAIAAKQMAAMALAIRALLGPTAIAANFPLPLVFARSIFQIVPLPKGRPNDKLDAKLTDDEDQAH